MTGIIRPIFDTAEERQKFIFDHANYYTASYWAFSATQKRYFIVHSTKERKDVYERAKATAQDKANEIGRPVMLYAVWCPYNPEGGEDTWVENVYPQT